MNEKFHLCAVLCYTFKKSKAVSVLSELNKVAIYSSDILGIGVVLVSVLCAHAIRKPNARRDVKVLRIILMLDFLACIFDILATAVNGRTESLMYEINMGSNTILYFINAWIAVLWVSFMNFHLYGNHRLIDRNLTKFRIISILLCAVAVLNVFHPFIFKIDESNNYERLTGTYVYFVFSILCLAFSVVDFIKYKREHKGVLRFFPIIAFLGPVTIGIVLQFLFYGTSFVWPALAISCCGATISLQNEYTYVDNLTGMLNRSFMFDHNVFKKCHGVVMLDINGFKQINDTYGHAEGDLALGILAGILQDTVGEYGVAIRYAGDEFLCFSFDGSLSQMQQLLVEGHDRIRKFNVTGKKPYELNVSYGLIAYDPRKDDIDDILKRVDEKMYENKQAFYESHPDFKKTLRV